MADFLTYLWWAFFAICVYFLVRAGRWFLDPYFIYSRRKMDKDIEFYVQGKRMTKKQTGLPFLLRPTDLEQSENTILPRDLCGLGLVVPCYNEEKRLPSMLTEHIEYIQRLQRQQKLPDRVEIILVDDGSKDKTLDFIKQMTEAHPESQ